MRSGMRRIACAGMAAMVFACAASAHYHFIHFNSRTAPWKGLPEKFDLNVLPNKTLPYFVSDQTGVKLAPGDTYAGLISEIRAAGKVWNDVETSDLRLTFAGFAAPNTTQNSPSLEIIFDDVPPGLIALGAPTVLAGANGQYVPIVKSVVVIRPDLSTRPSFSEFFFGTLVHEIGHGLGLQHTFTSSVMSTSNTRTTSRAKPLTADDIAGISILYPNDSFAKNTGSISGRVTQSGGGVNLASVVAISPNGAAVSTLTNPDGTYRIDGAPPRSYFVYVHPLPPAVSGQSTPGDVNFPFDSDGRAIAPSAPFESIFFPGTNDPNNASPVQVLAGNTVENVNFNVRGRSGYVLHTIDTRAYPGSVAVKPPYLSPNISRPYIIANGPGLVTGNAPTRGLNVSVLGGSTLTVRPLETDTAHWARIDFDVRTLSFSADSPRHLVFSLNNDIYVLPAAFFHVANLPPSITSINQITEGTQRLAVIMGTNINEASRVYFDGVPAVVKDVDVLGGRLTVFPPPAPVNHRANVVILNADGQSSLFIEGDNPSSYTYFPDSQSQSSAGALSLNLIPSSGMKAGTEGMVQIDAPGANFVDGQTTVGFGNSDIVVKQIAVVSPTRIFANIAVSQYAQTGSAHVSVISGLQVITQQYAFQILPAGREFWLSSAIVNAATGTPGVTAGAQAIITVGASSVLLTPNNATLYLNDTQVPISSTTNNQVQFQIPAGTAPGATVVRLEANGERSLPVLMIVDPPLPKILSASPESEPAGSTLRIGQLISLTVSDLEKAGSAIDTAKVAVTLGGIDINVAQVVEGENSHRVLVYVPATAPTGSELPLTVSIDSRTSDPIAVNVEN